MKTHKNALVGLAMILLLAVAGGCGEETATKEKGSSAAAEGSGGTPPTGEQTAAPEHVTYKTEDGVEIHADFYRGAGAECPAVMLVHMRGSDRKSWNPIAAEIAKKGCAVLALDLRGHGQSTQKDGETLSLADFDEGRMQWSRCSEDVRCGREFLITKGVDHGRIAIVGASVGCTVGIYYAATDSGVRGLILLSPVMGIDTGVQQAAASLPDRKIFIYCTQNDDRGGDPESAGEFMAQFNSGQSQATMHDPFAGSDHGTNMLGKKYGDVDVNKKILEELDSILK